MRLRPMIVPVAGGVLHPTNLNSRDPWRSVSARGTRRDGEARQEGEGCVCS